MMADDVETNHPAYRVASNRCITQFTTGYLIFRCQIRDAGNDQPLRQYMVGLLNSPPLLCTT